MSNRAAAIFLAKGDKVNEIWYLVQNHHADSSVALVHSVLK